MILLKALIVTYGWGFFLSGVILLAENAVVITQVCFSEGS